MNDWSPWLLATFITGCLAMITGGAVSVSMMRELKRRGWRDWSRTASEHGGYFSIAMGSLLLLTTALGLM